MRRRQNVGLLRDDEDSELVVVRSVLMEETEELSDGFGLGGTRVIVFVERPFRRIRTAWHERCFA